MPIYRIGTGAAILRDLPYSKRVLRIRPNNLLAYWPLSESASTSGAGRIRDISGNGNHATPTNIVMGGPGIMGTTGAIFNGANSIIDCTVAPLTTSFNGNLGTLFFWAKISSAGIWTDGTQDFLIRMFADNNNYFLVTKEAAGTAIYINRKATVLVQKAILHGGTTNFFSFGASWDQVNSKLNTYFNGVETLSTTAIGVFAGALTQAYIGANGPASLVWPGDITHVALWNTVLNAGEMKRLATID